MMDSFWQGKKVFLTGHTGFKGSWLAVMLNEMGAIVTGYSLAPNSSPSMFDIVSKASCRKSIIGDILNESYLFDALLDAEPDIVFHLAAQPLVLTSYENPKETFETNIMGTVNVLEAVRKSNTCKALINITTDKCYENQEFIWGYREIDRLGGRDPYSNSKACAELLTDSYIKSFFSESEVGIATARAGNVIGGGDWSSYRLIPDLIKGIQNDTKVPIRFPKAIRPWQHVLEPLFGYLLLAEKIYKDPKSFTGAWNFGPSETDTKSVQWIVENFENFMNVKDLCEISGQKNKHEANVLRLDSSKAMYKLGWRPKLNVSQALQWTAHWYENYYSGQNISSLTKLQIKNYLRGLPGP